MADDLLRGVDASRPLPAHLRERLEAQLIAPEEQLAEVLRTAEAPRPLRSDLREELRAGLVRTRRPVPAWLVGAAAAAVLIAGTVSALPQRGPGSPSARAVPTASPSPVTTVPVRPPAGVAAGAPQAATGQLPPPATPKPTPRPPAAAAPGSGTAGSGTSSGSAAGAPAPAAAGPQRGVSDVSPDEGPISGGTRIALTGRDLSRTVRVELDGRPATDLVVESDSRVTVVTPAAAEPRRATLEVHLSTGEVHLVPSAFAYIAAPVVTAVDPAEGPAAGGNVVSITGQTFTPRTTVRFGNSQAGNVEVLSASQLRVVAPAHLPGPVDVTVTTAGGTSNGVRYVYTP